MIHHWKAKNLLFPTVCINRPINLVKLFGNYALLNTRSTAKNLRSRCDHNLSAWNQYYRPSCMSYSIESQSYITYWIQGLDHKAMRLCSVFYVQNTAADAANHKLTQRVRLMLHFSLTAVHSLGWVQVSQS